MKEPKSDPDKINALRLGRDAFSLLTPAERRTAWFLVASLLAIGLIDVAAMALIMPVVSIIVEPDIADKASWVSFFRKLIPVSDTDKFIIVTSAITIVLLCLSAFLNIFAVWRNNRFAARIQKRMALHLMESLLHSPYEWFLSQNNAALGRFFHSDIVRWGRDFVMRIISMAQHLLAIILPLILLVAISPITGLVSILIIGAIAVALVGFVQPRIQRAALAAKSATETFVVAANNAVSGVKDIKLAGQESQFARYFRNSFATYADSSSSLSTWQVLPSSLLIFMGQFILLALAVVFWAQGLSQGEIAAQVALILLVTSRVIPASNRFIGLYTSIWNILPWVKEVIRMEQMLASVPRPDLDVHAQEAPKGWSTLTGDNLEYTYPTSADQIARGISLTIERGKSYGFAGPSGAGKSTLIDLLIGLYQPDKGTIRIDGADLSGMNIKSWYDQIGYVPQSPYFIDGTIKENVALGSAGKKIDSDRVADALDRANLTAFVDKLPKGVETHIGERGIQMSGGQKQRLAIARAFYQQPALLVLDEATSNLDTVSESRIQQAISDLNSHTTYLIIAHRLSTIKNCDKVFFIENGRISDQGTFDQLLDTSQSFREFVETAHHHGENLA